jgi:hypothetical protein
METDTSVLDTALSDLDADAAGLDRKAREAEASQVRSWYRKVDAAREFDKNVRAGFAANRIAARGLTPQEVSVPVICGNIDTLKSFIYAQNPSVDCTPSAMVEAPKLPPPLPPVDPTAQLLAGIQGGDPSGLLASPVAEGVLPAASTGGLEAGGVQLGMNIARAHPIANFESCGRARLPVVGPAAQRLLENGRSKLALKRCARPPRMSCRDFVILHIAALDQSLLHGDRPALVVGGAEVNERVQRLLRMTKGIDRPGARIAKRALQGHNAAFPGRVKRGLVRLRLDFAEAVDAAHIVDAVHQPMSFGFLGRPMPIMQSRVTSALSRSSLQPSVP